MSNEFQPESWISKSILPEVFEVYHLGRSIQKMTVRIKKLMREVIQEQGSQKKE